MGFGVGVGVRGWGWGSGLGLGLGSTFGQTAQRKSSPPAAAALRAQHEHAWCGHAQPPKELESAWLMPMQLRWYGEI